MREIYISTDIEADGRIPGMNSMLSFASAAFTAEKELLSTFSANLFPLPDAVADPDTMEWWKTQQKHGPNVRKNDKIQQKQWQHM